MRFVTPEIARRNAADCARALTGLLQPDGRFVYRYLIGQPKPSQGYYDAIRHVGSVWYLIDVDLAIGPLEGVREAALASADHIIEQFLVPYAGNEKLGLLSEGFVKLGGSGLAIMALCRLWDATANQRYLDLARQVGGFVLDQEQSTGDFVQVRQYPLGVAHPARDPFSAGQAIMGLMYLHERTGEQILLDAAKRFIRFLNKANSGVQTRSHWMLYALDKVYEADPSPSILTYAGRVATGILKDTGYRKEGLSTPIACFTEGLLAYDRLLSKAGVDQADPRRKSAMRAVRQNLSLILKYRREGGVYVAGDKNPEVRIDYIVHPGCAFLAYALQAEG